MISKGKNMCHKITYRLYVLRNVAIKTLLLVATSFSLSAPQ